MAKRTSIKNKDILKGTNAADVLTVKHSQVTVNAGKGNDKKQRIKTQDLWRCG